MTRDQVSQIVISIINVILPEGDCSGVDPEKRLRDQLELDSMDFLDIVMELRKKHKVEVPESDYPKLATLNSCVDYLTPLMQDK